MKRLMYSDSQYYYHACDVHQNTASDSHDVERCHGSSVEAMNDPIMDYMMRKCIYGIGYRYLHIWEIRERAFNYSETKTRQKYTRDRDRGDGYCI